MLSDSALRNMWNFFLPKVPSMILITRMSTKKWHLPRALPRTEQQRHLPSASTEIETHAASAIDLQQSLRELRVERERERERERDTLFSRESGGTGL